MPVGMADIAEVLCNDFHTHNPNNRLWFNRDRFVLSYGHGSMLHYALLHLSGYNLPREGMYTAASISPVGRYRSQKISCPKNGFTRAR